MTTKEFDKIGDECFDHLKELNPKGGIKEFIRIAVEFGYKRAVKNLALPSINISLPSRDDYDKRQLKPMYFKKDTSVGNSVLYIKGDEYEPYQWNYTRMIKLLEEGRLGYEC